MKAWTLTICNARFWDCFLLSPIFRRKSPGIVRKSRRLAGQSVAMRTENEPADGDIAIGPGGGEVGDEAHDDANLFIDGAGSIDAHQVAAHNNFAAECLFCLIQKILFGRIRGHQVR